MERTNFVIVDRYSYNESVNESREEILIRRKVRTNKSATGRSS